VESSIKRHKSVIVFFISLIFVTLFLNLSVSAQTVLAGTGKYNITKDIGENIHDSLYVKALVLKSNTVTMAIITLDVVSIEDYTLPKNFYQEIKRKLKEELHLDHFLINASHNHWDGFLIGKNFVAEDVGDRTIKAVEKALKNLEPVKFGGGSGFENRISMNRRIKLKDEKVYTIRHANPNMPDDEVVGLGKMDPEIGILRIDRLDGTSKAVLYNFACHPYSGVLDRGVTAEFPGFASETIESVLGNNSMAFFLQGAAGDITEILYKNVDDARDCEPFGRMLGLSVLKGFNKIKPSTNQKVFNAISKTMDLPLRKDISNRIKELERQERKLLSSLRSTSLNMKSFIPLYIKYTLSPKYPSYYSYRYLQEDSLGILGLKMHDKENKRNIEKYLKNMRAMDKLSQIEENIMFLKRRQNDLKKLNKETITVDIVGIRIGNFVVVTFPGEPFAEVGLNIKKNSPFENTFVAGYSNGYIHYAPTANSYKEWGYEVMNSILAPEWQAKYENEISGILEELK